MPLRKSLVPVAIVAAFALAPAVFAQTTPAPATPAATAPIFPGPGGAPHYLLGISARGSLTDLDILSAAATGSGFQVARDLDANGRISLVIAFPNAAKEQVEAFLKRASASEFGKFTFELTMAPVKP